MTVPAQIAQQFREVFLEGDWVAATNLKSQLSAVNWQQATTKAEPLNTIASLAFHLSYYVGGIRNVLEGGTLDIRDKYSFDCPLIESQRDWENLLNKMWSDAEKLANCVEQMPAGKLEEVFTDEKYGNYRRNIHGMIAHCYYHLGQIVLIKKILLQGDKT